MPRFERSITVNAPPEQVFRFIADISRHVEWSPHGLTVTAAPEGGPAQSARYSTTGKLLGTHQAEVVVTEYSPPNRILFESTDDTGHFRHWFEVSAQDGVSELRKGVEPLKTGFALTVARAFMGIIIPRGLDGDLKRIKERLEKSD